MGIGSAWVLWGAGAMGNWGPGGLGWGRLGVVGEGGGGVGSFTGDWQEASHKSRNNRLINLLVLSLLRLALLKEVIKARPRVPV